MQAIILGQNSTEIVCSQPVSVSQRIQRIAVRTVGLIGRSATSQMGASAGTV